MDNLLEFVRTNRLENDVFPEGCPPDEEIAALKLYNYFRNSGSFDGAFYRSIYPEIESAWDAAFHFVYFGISENRLYRLVRVDGSHASNAVALEASQKPKVSILIPVYNNAEYLHECFESVVNQTLRELEIIIINDGSTDKKAIAIMEEYARNDSRVKLINKPNSGYGHSMNMGLDAATGEYIGIVESDDYILPGMYRYYYNIARANSLDFVKSNAMMFYGPSEHRIFEERIICKEDDKYNIILDPARDLSVFNIHNVIWNGIYNHNFLRKNHIRFNETPGASYQDNGFWFQTFMHTNRFMITPEKFYMLRRDNAGSSYFSKGKAFCMFDEYGFIYKILRSYPDLYKKYVGMFQYRKYNNCIFNLCRVDRQYRNEVLQRFMAEFRQAHENNEIDREIFADKYKSVQKMLDGTYSIAWIKNPTVSIVIAAYNCEKYIGETLESLRNQTEKEIEIICVDDGSTDSTFEIIKNASAEDDRIKVFRQENRGAGSARNTGFSKAGGDYIIFLDADDIIRPDLVEKQLAQIRKTGADMCVCRANAVNVQTGEESEIDYALRKEYLPAKEVFSMGDIRGNVFKAIVGWAWDKIYTRDFIVRNKLKFQEISSTNDLLFVFSSLVKAKKITVCDEYLITHRTNIATSVSNTREKNPMNFIRALEAFRKTLVDGKVYTEYERSFLSYAIHAWLWNLKTMKGYNFLKIYNEKESFAKKMGISQHGEDFFLDVNEYRKFMEI